MKVSELDEKSKQIYQNSISKHEGLSMIIPFLILTKDTPDPGMAEMLYELERSKEYFPEEWVKYEYEKIEMESFFGLFRNKN